MQAPFNVPRAWIVSAARAVGELRMSLVLVAGNLLAALAFSLPVLVPAISTLSHSLHPRESPAAAMADFKLVLGKSGGFLTGGALAATILAMVLQWLFAGGIAFRLCAGGPFRLSEFLQHSGRLLGRNLRLFLWELLWLMPVLLLISGPAIPLALTDRFPSPEAALTGTPLTPWSVGFLLYALVMFALWRGAFDVARIQLFADDQRLTRVASWRGIKAMVVRPLATLGYAALTLAGIIAVLLVMRVHAALTPASMGGALLGLVLAQLVIWIRMIASIAATAYALEVHRVLPPRTSRVRATENAAPIAPLSSESAQAPAPPPLPAPPVLPEIPKAPETKVERTHLDATALIEPPKPEDGT